jgi:ethanolamine ammonia-lyase small subunit
LTVVIADGLSALAPMRHAIPLLEVLQKSLSGWVLDSIVLATQARVALADEIGHARGAEATIILIGERPGLNSVDSLGAYLTYQPQSGRTDAERNCVSNIRPEGLSYAHAAFKLLFLLNGARTLGLSGVALKDDSDASWLPQLSTHKNLSD